MLSFMLYFSSAVHRNSAASGLLVQAIHSKSEVLSKVCTSAASIRRSAYCYVMNSHSKGSNYLNDV